MKFICQNEKCGQEFEASRYWARFCSDACRVASYEKRKKEAEKSERREVVDGQTVDVTRP